MHLHPQYTKLVRRVAPGHEAEAQQWYQTLLKAYTASSRHYHDIGHVEHLLGLVDKYEDRLRDPDAVRLAVWWHDVVHGPLRQDNERQSADMATKALGELGLEPERVRRIYCWILATDHKTPIPPEDTDLAFLVDIDLSSLGAPRADYERYALQTRQEYRIFPTFLYNRGRRKVLRMLLGKPVLYLTPWLREQWENQARQNLQWELGQLA